MNESAKGDSISKYHMEASIAYWHCTKEETDEKWKSILKLYNHLLQVEYSPIAALNRAYALAKINGKEEAIKEAEKLQLNDNHLYHSLLGNLYTGIDRAKAIAHYQKAFLLAKTSAHKTVIEKYMSDILE